MHRKLPPADDETAFAEAMRGVARRPASDRVAPAQTLPSARPLQLEADERAVIAELLEQDPEHWIDSGEELSYRAPGLQDSVFRRLRRGIYSIGTELDLHGMSSEKARVALNQFLVGCQQRGIRCVRVIHGKGLRSSNQGPVLKTRVDRWLRQRDDVLAFTSARPKDGGTGAVYVLLRST
jgi:DNA-nicking Smr family endonuclease